ncbi:MAG: DUF2085 domain-containing protein, partial [Flavobacteriales bacterium]
MSKGWTFGCHGIPERCFWIRNKPMPLCARCLGASIGHVAVALQFLIYELPHGLWSVPWMLVMLFDWLAQNKWRLYHSNLCRLFSGIGGGYAVGLL